MKKIGRPTLVDGVKSATASTTLPQPVYEEVDRLRAATRRTSLSGMICQLIVEALLRRNPDFMSKK